VLDRLAQALLGLPSIHWPDFAIGCVTLGLLLLWPKVFPKVPAALVALLVATLAALLLARFVDGFSVSTIGSRFHYTIAGVSGQGIPRLPPLPHWPWSYPGPAGLPLHLSWDLLRDLLPAAFAIAILGAIESLLSAVVADGMRGTRHDPDAELLGQGIGNLVAPFFGGFAATGAIARTATSIRSGARSPIAAIAHALFVLFAMLLAAPLLSFLPMASLAALLLLVAWNMGEARHFLRLLRTSPRGDVFLLVACFLLTVLFDMVVAVTAGVLLGSLLFMQRMARLAETQTVESEHPELAGPLPEGVVVYRIAGPLFFGAAQKAMAALQRWEKGVRAVVLDLSAVPLLDGTGLVQLESAADRLHRAGALLVLSGTQPQPLKTLLRGGWRGRPGVVFRGGLAEAVAEASRLAGEASARHGPQDETPTP
jgi:SulP family sulfate permease